MEILRVRLLQDYHVSNFPDMSKPRRCKQDIFPDRARRRLFGNADESSRDTISRPTTDAVNTFQQNFELEDKYKNIVPFENPPKPYQTVIHPGMKRFHNVEETNNFDGSSTRISAESEESTKSVQQKSQSRLQEYFKPKKRARVVPVYKTPVGTSSRIKNKKS